MDIHNDMSTYKANSVIEINDAVSKDSMLDGKNLLFMTGFSVGMLFFYLAGDNFSKEAGQIYLETLQQMQRIDPAMDGLFSYILENRMRQAMLLFIMATGRISKPVFYIVVGIAGFTTGLLMLLAAYQLGFLGILVSVGTVFPQFVLYLKAFQIIFAEEYNGDTKNYHKNKLVTQTGWHKIRKILWKILKCLAYILGGVVLETYINTWLMKKLLLFL